MTAGKHRVRRTLPSNVEVTQSDIGDCLGTLFIASPVDQYIVGLDICQVRLSIRIS